MSDFIWPEDLVPSGSSFKLQPHTGGSESPFTRQSKIYGLSAPRWTCSLSFRVLRGSRFAEGKGDTEITITGMPPGSLIYAGDYIGGDGRPHVIRDDGLNAIVASADASGQATVSFEPPLAAPVAADSVVFERVSAMFRLASDDAGDNFNEAGQLAAYSLQFVEDL